MERVALDVLRPLPTSRKGNRYVLVIADLFMKWTEAFPLQNQDTKTVASVFVHEFSCRFDTPLQTLANLGRNFELNIFAEMYELLHIKKTRTTRQHSQSNGGVERFNRTLAQCSLCPLRKKKQKKNRDHYHHHQSLNRKGRWGTTDDFATSFLHFFPVLRCPLGLGELQACPFHDVVFPPLSLCLTR